MVDTLDYILKKYNITVDNQYFIDIPELIGAEGLARLFAELGFKEGVEIGTDQAEYAEFLLKTIKDLSLMCIDPWRTQAYEFGKQPESYEPQSYFDERYAQTVERLKQYEKAYIVRETSMSAVSIVGNNTVDFVYIDGNHDFLNVTQDIHYWFKKVKPGGILAGHDYVRYPSRKFNHVQKVVNAYMTAYHLLPVFLTTPTNEGMKRDRFRSWFIVKPTHEPNNNQQF